jgi:hypothetical protein
MVDWEKEAAETDKLLLELQRRGIELPNDPSLWFDDLEEQSGTLEEIELLTRSYLTPKGKAVANALIRKDKRQNVEWWIKIIATLATLITGLLGALIGLLAFLKK